MVDFMNDKGSLYHMIAKLSEKFNQMNYDDYTIDDRIYDIFSEVNNLYT